MDLLQEGLKRNSETECTSSVLLTMEAAGGCKHPRENVAHSGLVPGKEKKKASEQRFDRKASECAGVRRREGSLCILCFLLLQAPDLLLTSKEHIYPDPPIQSAAILTMPR